MVDDGAEEVDEKLDVDDDVIDEREVVEVDDAEVVEVDDAEVVEVDDAEVVEVAEGDVFEGVGVDFGGVNSGAPGVIGGGIGGPPCTGMMIGITTGNPFG